ncbi:lysylphosphatidylglycerol synthase domain-containing protein [Sediminicoccus sp. KRV36]|uniref:lysylphosphatidylglycerol synthase domain-containing protein n=1 Tax=Sediminicoccus sp. KRV36 TaxID=3133721 RepID=UPI00200C7923|nr:lysylphosphatidylglycerol synthase domain-containing protein [Sediminicoccus rosea]UPY37545.1 lysylphosphatidylglycerol synthase domain-containing protein [Sediminicoccus rosea]
MRAALPFIKRHGATVFGLLLLVGAIWVVHREFRNLSIADVTRAMQAIPAWALWWGAGLTVAAYLVLAIYDWLGARYAGRPSSWGRALLASFCGYSLAHNLGFAAVSGAAVRFRLYTAWGYSPLEVGKVVGFTSLTFGLGGMALGGMVLLVEPEVLPWAGANLPRWLLQLAALPLFGVVIAYVLLSRFRRSIRVFGHDVELPGVRMAVAQSLLATVDVAVTAAIFYVLLPPAEGLTFLRFIGIYLAAYALGITASVPGGLGVFDGAIIIGLAPYMGAAEVVGALLVFRLYYYIVPLFISGVLFAGFEIGQRRDSLKALSRGAMPLEVPILAGLVALGGALLVFLGSLPISAIVLQDWAGYEAALASQFAASIVGSLLLVMAFGMARRLRLAWGMALFLLVNGAVITWLREEAWWTWGLFLLVAALLATMRTAFYRESRLRREPLSNEMLLPLAAVAICGMALAMLANASRLQGAMWWEVVLFSGAPVQLRFTVGVTALLLLLGMVRLLRPAAIRAAPFDEINRTRLESLGATLPDTADGVLWGEAGRAGFAFTRSGDLWIGHGDPVGDQRDAVSAIWRFRDFCEWQGGRPAFVDLGGGYLRIYADIGLLTLPAEPPATGFLACDAEHDVGRLLGLCAPP